MRIPSRRIAAAIFAILFSLSLASPALAATVGESGGVSGGAEIEYEPAPVPGGRTARAALFSAGAETEAITVKLGNNNPDLITGFTVAAAPAGGGEALYGVRQGAGWDYKIPFASPPQEDTDFTITVTSQSSAPGFHAAGVKETVMTYNAIESLTIKSGDTDATGKTLYLQTNNAQGRQSVQLSASKNGSSGSTGPTGHPYMKANGYAEQVLWTSSNEAVASVDATGLITAHTGGTATVTASVYGGRVKATCTVNVSAVTGVSLSHTAYTLFTGGTAAETQLTLTAALTGGVSSDELEWTNSDPGAAAMTVAADGRSATIDASGRTAGSTTITAHIKGAPDTAQYKASCTVTVVAIGSVSVSPGNYTIYTLAEPRTVQLTATVTPNAASVWSSSNPAAATVNQTGLVTAVAPGSTTVTATVGGKSGSSTVTVKDKIPVASVTVSGTNSLVRTSDKTTVTTQLAATVKPDNAHFKAVSWAKTGGSASININASGLVTATAAGSATFTATADGVTSTPYTVTVTDQKVMGITVAQKSVDKGGTVQMSATVSPSNAVNKNVTWSLASGNVATVNASGLVTGGVGSNGTVTVKATAADGSGKSGSATVTVNGCAHALSAGGYGSGAGTSGSPWLVTSQAQLSHIFSHEGSSSSRIYFRQDRNIQFSLSSLWPPVPLNYANYNGDGYLLTGCNNSIFSSVNNSTLQKVGIPGGSVTVEYPYAGSLFVYSENTTIDQCFSACNVYSATGDTYGNILFGGLGGTLTNSTLSNCYYTGNISWGNTTGDSVFAGGLLSDTLQPGATVKNCYSRGGFSGPNPGKIWTGAIAPRYQPSSPPSLTNVYWGPSAPCALRVWSSYGVNNLNTVYVNVNASYPGLDFTNVWRMQNGWPVLRAFDH